jgi:integrase/recombinase XerD
VSKEASIEELCTAFLARCRADGLAPATEQNYRRACAKFRAFVEPLGVTDPREVSPAHLSAFAGALADDHGYNKQSVAKWLRDVRALFAWGERHGYLDLSPFRRYSYKAPKLPVRRGFSADEVRRMIDRTDAAAYKHPLRDRAILLTLFDTGMRRSELAGLELADVIENEAIARTIIVRGKGGKERLLDLHPQVQRALWDYLAKERSRKVRCAAVFLGRGNRQQPGWHPLTPDAITHLVQHIARSVGIDDPSRKLGPHELRHGFAKAYLDTPGARLDDLQTLLGHESIQMSLHYAKQFGIQARRGAADHSPINELGLHLGQRSASQRGRPRKER